MNQDTKEQHSQTYTFNKHINSSSFIHTVKVNLMTSTWKQEIEDPHHHCGNEERTRVLICVNIPVNVELQVEFVCLVLSFLLFMQNMNW